MGKSSPASRKTDLKLDPVISMTMAEMVEVRLQEYLKANDFKIGDALPREMDLAEALGVSRNVIREALSRFRMLGLVESRKKRGMILTSPDVLGGIERVMNPKLMDRETLRDIFGIRLVLEMGMAVHLFANITEKDLDDLERITRNNKHIENQKFRAGHEIEFHGKLYEITGNKTMQRFQFLLLPVFEYVVDYEAELPHPPKVGSATHVDLVNELKAGNAESFGRAMRAHLEPHFEMLESWDKRTDFSP